MVNGHKLSRWILASAALTVLTLFLINEINKLPSSESRDRLVDGLEWPGALITGLFYPQGIHTGSGSIGAIYLSFISLFGFYWITWLAIFIVFNRVRGDSRQ